MASGTHTHSKVDDGAIPRVIIIQCAAINGIDTSALKTIAKMVRRSVAVVKAYYAFRWIEVDRASKPFNTQHRPTLPTSLSCSTSHTLVAQCCCVVLNRLRCVALQCSASAKRCFGVDLLLVALLRYCVTMVLRACTAHAGQAIAKAEHPAPAVLR